MGGGCGRFGDGMGTEGAEAAAGGCSGGVKKAGQAGTGAVIGKD